MEDNYQKEKGKSILEHLQKLKVRKSEEKETLESKMPSRTEKSEEEEKFRKIKIPVPKRFQLPQPAQTVKPREDFVENAIEANRGFIKSAKSFIASQGNIGGSTGSPLQKPDFEKNELGIGSNRKNKTVSRKTDQSIFKGAKEVSRIKLKQEMRLDPKVYQAARQTSLGMSPVERSKLVEQVFSPVLGRNISKTDLKWGIRKLNQKMFNTKDPKEHEKIRKEIKFFKKIGGIE